MKSIAARFGIASVRWAVVAIIGGALLLRCVGVRSRWLWLDELLTVNWSVHGPWAALANVLRFDSHPPLYYLQLSLWALPCKSDVWLMANTVLWSTAAVVLLIYSGSRVYGLRTGLYSGALLAIAPAALAYADNVRMYSFITFLIIWTWYTQERWLARTAGRFGVLWMIVSQTSVVYSHTAGLVMISGCVAYGAARVLATHQRQIILRWFEIECAVGMLALPAVTIGLFRDVSHTVKPDILELVQTWTFLTFGDSHSTWAVILGALVLAGLLALAIRDARTRLPFATLVLAPLIVAAIISYSFKPMWLPRVFLPTVPFLCLIVGMSLAGRDEDSRMPIGAKTFAFVLIAMLWASVGTFQQFTRQKGDGFRPAAELVRKIAKAGDVVLVDGDFPYWCFNWYYIGPHWGEPRHAFILNADWERMMDRLPTVTATLLGLSQSDASLINGKVNVILWDRNKATPQSAGDLIVVRHQTSTEPVFPDQRLVSRTHLQQLIVEQWTR